MRKIERVTIDTPGRDHGRTYIITEMDAWSAVRWCAKALLALTQSGTNVPPEALRNAAEEGPAALAAMGLNIFALVPPGVALPLMEEVRACVMFQPPGSAISAQPIREGDQCQIEEASTWFTLFKRAFALHLGFSEAAPSPTTE